METRGKKQETYTSSSLLSAPQGYLERLHDPYLMRGGIRFRGVKGGVLGTSFSSFCFRVSKKELLRLFPNFGSRRGEGRRKSRGKSCERSRGKGVRDARFSPYPILSW